MSQAATLSGQRITHEDLLSVVPSGPDWKIDWERINALIPEFVSAMEVCPQDPVYHGEGDVFTHTCMVAEQLVADEDWRFYASIEEEILKSGMGPDTPDEMGLTHKERHSLLFWAALLHDIGKPECTVLDENKRYTSKGHSRIGAHIARRFLWEAGSPFAWREAICGIIMSHQVPFWLTEREDADRMAIQLSYTCNPTDLCMHARADAKGRDCADIQVILDNISRAEDCLYRNKALGPHRPFGNDTSRIEFFTRQDRYVDYVAHEHFPCNVIMMSGLPGSGKDTWIRNNAAHLPVISLDDIREEMKIKATDNQGQVIQEAKERARVFLRAGQDFVWNGTNITRNLRTPLLSLFRDYGARTQIVYIETAPQDLFRQNRDRPDAVPERAILKLIRKLEPPSLIEAHEVTFQA